MLFSFYPLIPAAPNNPSNDQPLMLINNASTNSILAIDHYTFNDANGGWHKQITFPAENAQVAPLDPASILFTGAGTVSTKAELQFINANATFPVSAIKGFVSFIWPGVIEAITPINQYNIVSVARIAGGIAQITFTTNSFSTNALTPPVVFIFPNISTTPTFTGNVLTFGGIPNNATVNVLVLQF